MAVRTQISRKLDENNVQVNVTSTKAATRYFKVPKDVADEFCSSYKKQDKKDNLISNITFGSSILLGCWLASGLASKLNTAGRFAVGIIGGVLCALGSTILLNSKMAPKHEQFVKSFGAEEIYYDEKKLPI